MTEHFTARITEAYGRHSDAYTSLLEPIMQPMADEMVSLAQLKGDQSLLDLATGTGLIARAAHAYTNKITGIDISVGILSRARSMSLENISFLAGDVHQLPFRDRCFDILMCGVSLSHFSNIGVALPEMLRVLHSRGRLIASAWGDNAPSPSKAAAIEVRKGFLADREVAFGTAFREDLWADVERGSVTLNQAGFVDVQVKTMQYSGEYRDHSAAVETALAWPLTRFQIAQLSPEDQVRLWEQTAEAIRAVDDLRWSSEVHYYQATRPGI